MVGGARAVARCDALGVAPYSDDPDMLFRAYLTPGFARTQEAIGAWMAEAGMDVRLDSAANLIGRYEGADGDAPALLIGSHIDSVRDGGRYDGPLGVMLGIECVTALAAAGRRLSFPIEVIAFGDEEGSRFPASMLTSRAVAGTLELAALGVADREGVTLAAALEGYLSDAHPPSGDRCVSHRHAGPVPASTVPPSPEPPEVRPGGCRDKPGMTKDGLKGRRGDFLAARHPPALAYLEPHIEQGPALEAEGLALGVVSGIAAQLRYQVAIEGVAGHAGTNSMSLRRDALAGAAEAVLAVERIARAGGGDLVATVGRMSVAPGSANVVPGRVEFMVDVRSLDIAVRDAAALQILAAIGEICGARGLGLDCRQVQDLAGSPCDPTLTALLEDALAAAGHPRRTLVSGAGHDAMVMAALCPTAMLFIRCKGGISHNPAESVTPEDAQAALDVMLGFIDRLEAHGRG